MKGIKGQLLRTFLAVIAVLSIASVVLFVLNLRMTQQYKSISDVMISEYQMVDSSVSMIDAFNKIMQSAGTDSTASEAQIKRAQSDIEAQILFLDSNISDTQSRSNYKGFKASIRKLVTQINASLDRFRQGRIDTYFEDYNEANKQFGFVRDNGTTLLFGQLQFSTSLRDTINRTYSITVVIGSALLIVLTVGCIVFVFRFSRRFTVPLHNLTLASKRLAGGNMEVVIGKDILRQKNEIGTLGTSFNVMAASLRDKIELLNTAKERTEREVVERTKELRDEKARLITSINSLSFGFVLADEHDTIILTNFALRGILGLKEEPRHIHDITRFFEDEKENVDLDIEYSCRRCMELKEPVEFKEVSYGKKFLRIICTPILGDRTSIGYIFIIEDITEAKVMERSRDEFFAIASHELRTPLTAIHGNTEMLLDIFAEKTAEKDVTEMLQDIDGASVRLIRVVNDFLEVSRLEQGRIDVVIETFNITEIIDKVVRNLKELADQKKLSLIYEAPKQKHPVVADKEKVEQVLLNMISNAVKYTKEGSVTVEVLKQDQFVRIRVTDTGVGISTHNQARLFRKFQQAGEKMLARDVSQSTGLGLYISKLIVTKLRGRIGLEKSEPGKGSTFYLDLPTS